MYSIYFTRFVRHASCQESIFGLAYLSFIHLKERLSVTLADLCTPLRFGEHTDREAAAFPTRLSTYNSSIFIREDSTKIFWLVFFRTCFDHLSSKSPLCFSRDGHIAEGAPGHPARPPGRLPLRHRRRRGRGEATPMVHPMVLHRREALALPGLALRRKGLQVGKV